MLNRLLYALTADLPCRLIPLDSGPYLERYYVGQLFGVIFYLHRIVSSDSERHLHNHPWGWGRSLILNGGYIEEIVTDLTASGPLTERRRIRWWNKVDGAHFHRIHKAEPDTWSLFFHGPRARILRGGASEPKGWGFLDFKDGVTAFRPFPSNSTAWWEKAPRGRDAGREPLGKRPHHPKALTPACPACGTPGMSRLNSLRLYVCGGCGHQENICITGNNGL